MIFNISLNKNTDNKLKEIKGLTNCKRLTKLSLAHNKIDKIQGLDDLPIQHLDLVSIKNTYKIQDELSIEQILSLTNIHVDYLFSN